MKAGLSGTQGAREFLDFSVRILTAIIVCTFSLSGAYAQGSSALHESSRAAQVRALNNSILQLHGQVQENAASATSLHGQAAEVLTQRAAALQALIQEDPHAALTFAFSPELLADLAIKFPGSAAVLESHATLSGTVQRWTADYPGLKTSRSGVTMKMGPSNLNLHFAYREPPGLKSGDVIQVVGVVAGSAMAVETSSISQSAASSDSAYAPLSADLSATNFAPKAGLPLVLLVPVFALVALRLLIGVHAFRGQFRRLAAFAISFVTVAFNPSTASAQTSFCSTTGAQQVAVILVTFPGTTLPATVTPQSLNDIFFGSTSPSLDGYLRETSYGQTSAAGAVFGPYTLTGSYTSCSDIDGAVLNDAIAAALAGGANLANYNRVFLAFPDIFGCGWAGFVPSGCSIASSSGVFNASIAYVVTGYMTSRDPAVALVSHEMGHNFNLLHSGVIMAGTDTLGPVASPGTEYDMNGDYWSVMGETVLGMYPAPQKAEVLGWMAASNYQVVQNSGTYTLQPLEASPPGLQAIKVQRGSGNNQWLWIEYRQPIGNYDSTLLPQPFSGALIRYEDSNTALGHTYLPNFTPTDTSGNSPALAVGQNWSDPYTNLSLSVLSATSTGLTISVNYGATPCTSAAPTVSVSPLNPSVYPGQTVSYSATVTNNDSSGCSANAITLGSSEPSGWPTSLSSSSVTLSPGQSVSVTLGKSVPSGTPAGTYAVNLNASTTAATGAATANATVATPPSLTASLSVAGTSFTPPATVAITASITNGGAPASGASVKFILTAPNGATATQTATTSANGTASWSYKLNSKSSAGTYTAVAQASLSSGGSGGRKGPTATAASAAASSNTATFTVQ